MSAVFLYMSGAGAQAPPAAAAQLPFEPESSACLSVAGGSLHVWSAGEAPGSSAWRQTSAGGALVFDGWMEGVAGAPQVAALLERAGAERLITERAGQYALLQVDARGDVLALCDYLGARHVYWGERAGQVVISNRAMVAAAALDGATPSVEPLHLSWMMCSIACLFAGQTAWRGVKMLSAGASLRVIAGRAQVIPAPALTPQLMPWDMHWEALCERLRGLVARGDGMATRIAVTGGKDSRVVLAGLIGAGLLERVDAAYLRVGEGHEDAIVGRALCERYGLSFEREPLPDPRAEPVELLLDRHNHQAEHALHAWDLKGATTREARVELHGHFGECFRSHMLPRFALGWPEVRRKYLATRYLDLYDVMTPLALAHVRAGIKSWLEARRAEGVRPLQLHDRMHREARMQRWASQCLQIDGAAGLVASPIPSPALLRHYLAMSLLEQRRHRVHFELTRRADDWLWRQPFAQASWTLGVAGWGARLPAPQSATGVAGRQLRLWQAQGEALGALISAPGGADFHALFARDKVAALLERTRRDPSPHHVRAILGLAGVRRTLDGALAPQRLVVTRASPPAPALLAASDEVYDRAALLI